MAERSNATSKKAQDAAQDVSTLQKRGRRRLVGAIALVLLAVIILPMVFDPEPKPNTPPVSIRIPGEEGTPFTPKAAQKPAPQPEPAKAEKAAPPPQKAEAPAPVPAPVAEPVKPAEKAVARAQEKPAPKAAEPRPVEKAVPPPGPAPKTAEKKAAPAIGEKLIVQVGAFGSAERVKEVTDQLKEARLAHYTESIATAKGPVTRVRLGPFGSREAAEKARDRAKALGLNPANPIAANPVAATPAAK
jgi:DedD protein